MTHLTPIDRLMIFLVTSYLFTVQKIYGNSRRLGLVKRMQYWGLLDLVTFSLRV